MKIVRFLPVFCAFFAIVVPAFSQARPSDTPGNSGTVFPNKLPKPDKSRQRDLKGIVKDDADAPVEGAVVKLKDMQTGKVVDFITKKDGSYLFYELNMDVDYELTAIHDGFTELKKTLSRYDSRKPATLDFHLERKKG